MKLVLLSDTHGKHHKVKVPDGDVLVHAGDCLSDGYDFRELKDFAKWFHAQPHRHKILIAGNRDWLFEKQPHLAKEIFAGVHYLCDSGVLLKDIAGAYEDKYFWGSPYQPEFFNWAFNVPRGAELKKHWDLTPRSTNVLITHGPPRGILDTVKAGREHLGDDDLLTAVRRVSPAVHVFGHIHGGAGVLSGWPTTFVNASVVNEAYQVVREPVQITI